jgi:DNA-binding response OmpR family regulator
LVVEDERGMAAALTRGLTAEGFVIDVRHDGRAGLEAARFGGYDAVLLDLMLPGMSGYTVVRTLREEGNWVPVLVLSAKDGEYDQADALDYGADDYLTKPFSVVVLVSADELANMSSNVAAIACDRPGSSMRTTYQPTSPAPPCRFSSR